MKDTSYKWPHSGRVKIQGEYTSDDGLVSGIGKSGIEFVTSYEKICRESKDKEREWVQHLKQLGIKASHPDDGWVDRKLNKVSFCYPNFKEVIEIGDLVALGTYDEYRIVKITKIEKSIFGMVYYFNPLGRTEKGKL